ncbi:MAG: hypothetical protein V1743_06130 [Nanoarchaeota archaeon]
MQRHIQKKAQTAGGSAILVAIITTLIILYILFLPPDERASLLGDNTGTGGTGGYIGPLPKAAVLLDATPGTLSVARTNTIEHTIPSIKILTQTNANEIKRIDSLYVSRGSFDDGSKEVSFRLDSGLSNNLLLSFNVKKASGKLLVYLNNKEVFSSELSPGTAEPIPLSRDYLSDENNLTFSVSSPGGAFWRMNEYQLDSILISGDITDVSRAFSEVHFSISQNEIENLEKAELRYTPNCDASRAGTLVVLLNTRVVFGGIPSCRSQNKIEIAKNLLTLDDNILAFQTGEGKYEVNNIKLVSTLQKPIDPIYYFDIPPEYYQYVYDRELDGYLLLTFPDENQIKQGVITLNGHKANFKTQGLTYNLRVSPYLKDGTNSLIITPQTSSLTITELRLELR